MKEFVWIYILEKVLYILIKQKLFSTSLSNKEILSNLQGI